jgi:hypothetical protein
MEITDVKYTDIEHTCVTAKLDGILTSIPVDGKNADYSEIQKQGIEIEDADSE